MSHKNCRAAGLLHNEKVKLRRNRPHLMLLLRPLLAYTIILLMPCTVMALQQENTQAPIESVRLQLKWFHSFQFAGYYAAKHKGFYADEGLDVHILERNPKLNIVDQVISDDVQYAVEDSGILVDYANGAPIKALAAIFQHSPLVFLSKQSSGIMSPYEMAGKRIMMYGSDKQAVGADEAPLRALLQVADLTAEQYRQIPPSFNNQDLLNDKVDVMAAYITDQPYYFKQLGVAMHIIKPQNYGIDLYGDLLFTSEQELQQHPNRVQAFRRASLKGWQYALDNSEEIIQLIRQQYHSRSDLSHLQYEAEQTRQLMLPEILPIGDINVNRLTIVAETYARLRLCRLLDYPEIKDFIVPQPLSINLSKKEKYWLQQHPMLTVGIDPNFAPYEWLDDNNNYQGITIEYIRLLENRLNVKFVIDKQKRQWPQLLNAARHNELDMLFSVIKTPERLEFLNFTPPYYVSPAVIISGQAQGYIGTLKRLSGMRVAAQKGHSTKELLNSYYPEIKVINTESISDALKMVADGNAHAYVGDAVSAGYFMNKHGIQGLMFSGQTEYFSEFRVAIPKQQVLLLSIMKKALASIRQAERNEIHNHWQKPDMVNGIAVSLILKYLAFFTVLLLIIAYWVLRLRRSEKALRRSESNLQAIFNAEPECVKVLSADGKILQINPAGRTLYESQKDENCLLGQHIYSFIAPEYHQAFKELCTRVLNGSTGQMVFQAISTQGSKRWLDAHFAPLLNPLHDETSVLAVSRDITEKKLADEKIWRQANYDNLTGLPNRLMFNEHLQHELDLAARNGRLCALMFIDLDHFKQVNDEFGHHTGDLLLQEAAQRIKNCVRQTDTVARLSGDEFTIIFSELEDKSILDRVAEKLINTLNKKFTLLQNVAYISSSIGIAIYPDDAANAEQLIKNADQAMYKAKHSGRNQFSYFTKSMQTSAVKRMQLLNDLHQALKLGQLQLRFQPIVALHTGKVRKLEALLCWQHPEQGLLNAKEFIPLAEESGLILDFGDWVFKQALKHLQRWQQFDIQVCINLSAAHFNNKQDGDIWLRELQDKQIAANKILLEIHESLLINPTEKTTHKLQQYAAAGMQIAVDNFGSGYSALSYLQQFDISYIKIDQSLTGQMLPGNRSAILAEAIIAMTHKLGLEVIAQGIEKQQQLQALKKKSCDFGQGYYLHKVLISDEVAELLADNG